MASCLIHNNTLLKNATAILYKMLQKLITNASSFVLQNAIVITKCDVYSKMHRYKFQEALHEERKTGKLPYFH